MTKELLQIYAEQIPEYLKEYASAEEMERIRHVDMNCGMNYTLFPPFCDSRPYSRFIHSAGTAILLSRFTDRKEVILAGLFHDIASPAFSHVIDFYNGDHEIQESTEDNTALIIRSSEQICSLLMRDHIRIEDVTDYHLYSLADNDAPGLCADRLEYTLGNIVNYGFGTKEKIREFIDDLFVGINEKGEEEISFRSEEIAEEFALLSLKCSHVYSCDADRYGMEYLARLLKKGVVTGILRYDDFRQTEEHVISLLRQSCLKKDWEEFTEMKELEYGPEEKDGFIQVHAKRRYVDPLCMGKRVSSFSEEYCRRRDAFLNEDQNVYMRHKKQEVIK